jgi:hypothetical protein
MVHTRWNAYAAWASDQSNLLNIFRRIIETLCDAPMV